MVVVTDLEEITIEDLVAGSMDDILGLLQRLVGGTIESVRIPQYTDMFGFVALIAKNQECREYNGTCTAFLDRIVRGNVVFTVNTPVDFLSLEQGEVELLVDKLSLIRFGPKANPYRHPSKPVRLISEVEGKAFNDRQARESCLHVPRCYSAEEHKAR